MEKIAKKMVFSIIVFTDISLEFVIVYFTNENQINQKDKFFYLAHRTTTPTTCRPGQLRAAAAAGSGNRGQVYIPFIVGLGDDTYSGRLDAHLYVNLQSENGY